MKKNKPASSINILDSDSKKEESKRIEKSLTIDIDNTLLNN